VTLHHWARRAWCAIGSALAVAVMLALVGIVLTAVALTTRLALGVDLA
jgi:cell division protein FtsX